MDGLPTFVVTHQLQGERRTGKVRQSEIDVLPLCHATNLQYQSIKPTCTCNFNLSQRLRYVLVTSKAFTRGRVIHYRQCKDYGFNSTAVYLNRN